MATDDETYRQFSARAEGTNISPQTLLATDYLNHFNEIVMLLEMIPDMEDCYEEARQWQPKSYPDHFRDSQFHDRDLAIAAYEHVPAIYRGAFDETVRQMNAVIAASLDRIGKALEDGETEILRQICTEASRNLQKMMDVTSAIIHGSTRVLAQSEIDGFLMT